MASRDSRETDVPAPTRKPYTSPRLTRYGSITQTTLYV
jgi:hypothetical protein